MRVPIFNGNLPAQYAVGDRKLNQWITQNDLAGLQLWKSWAKSTPLPQVNHLRIWKPVSLSPFLPSFEQRNSKLPFWTFPSHLAFKMLWKSKFPVISELFKITRHSCHSAALKELWRSGNCIGLEVQNVPLSHPQLIWPWTTHFYSELKIFLSRTQESSTSSLPQKPTPVGWMQERRTWQLFAQNVLKGAVSENHTGGTIVVQVNV